MCFDLFIYSAKLKFLLRSLVSCFFNTLIGSTSIRSILKSKSGYVENNCFSFPKNCPPLYSYSVLNFWNESTIAQGFFPAFSATHIRVFLFL